jgi:hypothetical protein
MYTLFEDISISGLLDVVLLELRFWVSENETA